MPAFAPSETNVVDSGNSTTVLLGTGGIFTGTFTDVLGYSGISVVYTSNASAAFQGVRLQWSTNGVDIDSEQIFSAGIPLISATIRAQFFRIRYTNGSVAQTFFRLQTLLKRGSPQGSVVSMAAGGVGPGDAVNVNAQLYVKDSSVFPVIPVPVTSFGGAVSVTHGVPSLTAVESVILASNLFVQELDFFGIFGFTRHDFIVFNNTTRGSLLLKYGTASFFPPVITPLNFHVKILPQHTWNVPHRHQHFDGLFWGIWDVADGQAQIYERF